MRTIAAVSIMMLTSASQAGPAYWVGSDGDYVKSGFGECVRTIDWTPERAIAGCEGGDIASTSTPMDAASDSGNAEKSADAASDANTAGAAGSATGDASSSAASSTAATAATVAATSSTSKDADAASAAEPEYRQLSLASGATFELGGSELSASGKAAVGDILAQFEGETIRSVIIEGHTDDRGAADFNQALSEKRADAVRDELIANGIDASQISTIGHGESKPVADNATREGRAQNRRVEIKIDAEQRQI